MTLTRLVRGQLIVFAILTVAALVYASTNYVGVQRLTGLGTYEVSARFTDASGLYTGSVVTYRGVDIGTVSAIRTAPEGAETVLQIDSSNDVPADARAVVRSMSAIGEQFVDLQPRTNSGPFLTGGDVIAVSDTVIPTSAGTLLTDADSLFSSLPLDSVRVLLSETSTALDGVGADAGRLVESSQRILDSARATSDRTVALIRDGETFLDVGLEVGEEIGQAGAGLFEVTDQLRDSDTAIRDALTATPEFSDTVGNALDDLAAPVGALGSDLQSLGVLGDVFNDNIRHVLTLYPALAAAYTYAHDEYVLNSDPNQPHSPLDLKLSDTQMYPCTTGYEAIQRREPSDTSITDPVSDVWCQLPPDHPAAVRGARNLPCATNPSVRTAVVTECPGGAPSQWPNLLSRPGT